MELSNQQQYEARQSNGNTDKRNLPDGVRIKYRALPAGFLLLTAEHSAPAHYRHITIGFRLLHAGPVAVYLLDAKRRPIATLFEHYCEADTYELEADLDGLPQKAVYYQLSGPDGIETRAID